MLWPFQQPKCGRSCDQNVEDFGLFGGRNVDDIVAKILKILGPLRQLKCGRSCGQNVNNFVAFSVDFSSYFLFMSWWIKSSLTSTNLTNFLVFIASAAWAILLPIRRPNMEDFVAFSAARTWTNCQRFYCQFSSKKVDNFVAFSAAETWMI